MVLLDFLRHALEVMMAAEAHALEDLLHAAVLSLLAARSASTSLKTTNDS